MAMERFIIPNSQLFDLYIQDNNLVHTDPRYNVGDSRNSYDVIRAADDDTEQRLLLVKTGFETQAELLWDALEKSGETYITPHRIDSNSTRIATYSIPVSTRPLVVEAMRYRNQAQNRMNNERIARSLGKMTRVFAELTGLYLDPNILQERSAFVDFVDDIVEPTILLAPIGFATSDDPIEDYYAEMFEHDPSFSVPFKASLKD
jgi:hypothetical protein